MNTDNTSSAVVNSMTGLERAAKAMCKARHPYGKPWHKLSEEVKATEIAAFSAGLRVLLPDDVVGVHVSEVTVIENMSA